MDWAARLASMKISATVTARPDSVSDPPVRLSMQIEVRASARRCPCPWWGRTGEFGFPFGQGFFDDAAVDTGELTPQFEDRFVQVGLDDQVATSEGVGLVGRTDFPESV